jgi:hypothetical protein
MREQTFVIQQSGSVIAIYSDELIDFIEDGGDVTVCRASHVEPSSKVFGWFADLSPVNGPNLGPFRTRSAALYAEFEWLEEHLDKIDEDKINADAIQRMVRQK